ncbi:Hypothetical protein CINCED_3A025352 [Cinara cedri]|uniref:RAD50-interacting protein 1 n=1 Tax=Cinara cedri TaxID=506608 RepID=A0A5E4NSZ6_9HEMI|nr:Hypothetical protein CINCED_3A025352 [Cinara cedri]
MFLFYRDFEIILNQINWPFMVSNSSKVKLDDYKQNFQHLASMLIQVQLPENDCFDLNKSSTSELMDHFSHISLPIAMLIVPFRKRFFYHFTGKKQTNKLDKPEWFLSRVLNWIKEYRNFVVDWMGPVYKENNLRPIDSQHEFIIGLMQSVVVKLESDLSFFQLEDSIFSHIIDETLAFEQELHKVYGYPSDYPSVTEVLTQAPIFFKWINMERKYAINKLNAILSNEENQWDILVKDHQYIVTLGADSFLTLLNTMSDRYNLLRQPRHKLQFLKLQIDLLEEFKQKIVQLFTENKESSEYLQEMLCTMHYVRYTLLNWGTNMHFLSLLNYKCELQNEYKSPTELLETTETVFDDTIKSYDLEINILLNYLCDDIMNKIKRHGKQYKKDNWHIMSELTDTNRYIITDSGWLMYETFTESLNTLNRNLPISLFNKLWPVITDKFATYIYNDILLANIFNNGGAQHLYLDIKYKIIPIISKYTVNPNIYIQRLLEACKILCFDPNFKPVVLKRNEVSEILLRRIENGNSLEFS